MHPPNNVQKMFSSGWNNTSCRCDTSHAKLCNSHADPSQRSIVHLSRERTAPRISSWTSLKHHIHFSFIPKLAIVIHKQLKRPVAFGAAQRCPMLTSTERSSKECNRDLLRFGSWELWLTLFCVCHQHCWQQRQCDCNHKNVLVECEQRLHLAFVVFHLFHQSSLHRHPNSPKWTAWNALSGKLEVQVWPSSKQTETQWKVNAQPMDFMVLTCVTLGFFSSLPFFLLLTRHKHIEECSCSWLFFGRMCPAIRNSS